MKNLLAFIMAGGGQPAPIFGLMARRIAFTMAEILLSLTIIGVVAAITLPSLTGNINERTWNTQRKALYSRISQAVVLMPQINGYGTLSTTGGYNDAANHWVESVRSSGNATEAFLTNGLSKVLKLNNICGVNNLSDCGLPNTITKMGALTSGSGSMKVNLDHIKTIGSFNNLFAEPGCGHFYKLETYAAAFETANGESVLTYYNPWCSHNAHAYERGIYLPPTTITCVNMVYDLNGKKGPNTVGKDIGFMTVLYPTDPVVVMPMPTPKDASSSIAYSSASAKCKSMGDDFRVPTMNELAAVAINKILMADGFPQSSGADYYWTSTLKSPGNPWTLYTGDINFGSGSYGSVGLRCVKRID